MNKITKLIIATGIAATFGSAHAQAPAGPPPAVVEVESAVSDAVAASAWVPGTVVSRNDARIAAEITGRVTWVAEVGTRLDAGETIARVEDRELELQLANSETDIVRLEAQLDYARSQIKRLQRLELTNNAAATQLDEAQFNLKTAEQNLAAARIQREQIAYRIERTNVRTPFPGRVVERLVQTGEFVNPGAPVARLVDTDNKEIRAQAPISAARFVDEGREVVIVSDDGESRFPVRTVIPVGDERSRMIEVRVALPESSLVIGSAVRVALPNSQTRELVAIPRDALVLRGSETFVYRVDPEDKAEKVPVETGIGMGNLVEVIGEIQSGDQLIVRGGERLQPGQPVAVVQAAENG